MYRDRTSSEDEARHYLRQEAELLVSHLSRDSQVVPEFVRVHSLALLQWAEVIEAGQAANRA